MITEDNFTILIPARKGSKGMPFKNRSLFEYTARIIPKKNLECTFVSTDDERIAEMASSYGISVHNRSSESAIDTATSKDMVGDFLHKSKDYLITLYLTYPERTWSDVVRAVSFFNESGSNSLLCKKKEKVSPFLMMYDIGDNKGEQIIKHNLCRRQDYAKCFEISHFISILKKDDFASLNNNLYNKSTTFMSITDVEDIDYIEDFERFKK